MQSLAIPEIVGRLARAGEGGIRADESSETQQSLEIARNWGFPVRVVDGRAWIVRDPDSLVPAWIEEETPSMMWDRLRVHGFLSIGSTNQHGLELARAGEPEGTLVYAEQQTAGRGRKGRRWSSPRACGIYMSLVLRPGLPMSCWPLLTHSASAAAAVTCRELTEQGIIDRRLEVELKWPNDLLLSGRKAAGILLEVDRPGQAAVLGVGVNVGEECVPAELDGLATSISREAGTAVPRRWILVRFLYHFQILYDSFKRGAFTDVLDRWKTFSTMWKDTPVWIVEGDRQLAAVTCGLTHLGALRVRTTEGREETVLAGDVSVRRREEGTLHVV